MRTWAFISQKGGSGKSTLSTQLAVYAMQQKDGPRRERSLLADLDPQGSAETWHERRGTERSPGAVRVLPQSLPRVMEHAEGLGITLFLIDTAPHSNSDALVAIRAADLIICPTQPSLFDLKSLGDTALVLRRADAMAKAVVVVNCVPHGPKAAATYLEAVAAAVQHGFPPDRILKQFICHRRPFITSTNQGRAVTETHPRDESAAELRGLWRELDAIDAKVNADTHVYH